VCGSCEESSEPFSDCAIGPLCGTGPARVDGAGPCAGNAGCRAAAKSALVAKLITVNQDGHLGNECEEASGISPLAFAIDDTVARHPFTQYSENPPDAVASNTISDPAVSGYDARPNAG